MENLEKIEQLLKNFGEIKNLFDVKIPKWSSDKQHYDKVYHGFSEGSDGGNYNPVSLYFFARCGTYGDSSTYREISMDAEIFAEYFIKYLNRNEKDVMMGIAELILKDAAFLKEKAKKELEEKLSVVNSL